MHRRLASLRLFALGWALVVLAAACSSGPALWTFQPTPEATAAPSASATTAACSTDATVVKIEETATLKMVPTSIDATVGKKVCFEVTNTAGFAHDLYVGPTADIEARNKTDAVAGIPEFTSGTRTFEYTFTGSGPFEYACWVPGHLEAGMKGSITLQ